MKVLAILNLVPEAQLDTLRVVKTDGIEEARRLLATLPTVATGLFEVEFLELRPLAN